MSKDIYGQYAHDNARSRGDGPIKKDITGTLDMRGSGDLGFHGPEMLYDEEDLNNPDITTGEIARSQSELDEFDDVRNGIGDEALNDAMGMTGDEADAWIRWKEQNPDK